VTAAVLAYCGTVAATPPTENAAVTIEMEPLDPLRSGAVDVWYVDLAVDAATVADLGTDLAEAERTRAARFTFERDRRRFVVARAALRSVLGRYLGLPPGQLAFTFGEHGKPALEEAFASLGFNLSHSGEIAVVAVGWQRAVGVDVEQWRSLPDLDRLAARVFARGELAALAAVAESERARAFFRGWTRKEAFIKATGRGLAQPLDRFVVSLTAGEPARFLDIEGDPAALARWTLHDLDTPPGYTGALVVEGASSAIRIRAWRAARPGA
jgi:4'-phosphopantetheinyl transferase